MPEEINELKKSSSHLSITNADFHNIEILVCILLQVY